MELRKSAVCFMEEWSRYCGMSSHVAAPAKLKDEKNIPRQKRRSMGRMSIFAAQAAEQALADSGIKSDDISNRTGCIIGSTTGSAGSISRAFEIMLFEKDLSRLPSSMFFQCMSHTAQAIGTGYEFIRSGRQDVLLCGGAEELHPSVTGSFDVVFAASVKYNQTPQKTPRPFDEDRDGLVCGEGSGILVLEEYEHAVQRGAGIYAEITGYGTCGSGSHISQSDESSIIRCINETLNDARTAPDEIDYINAHATGTVQGDKEEAAAIGKLFGDSVPVSSLKGYIGHTLGASGAIELIASLIMMEKGIIYPHVKKPLKKEINTVLKNCFAFGGVNASLVCRRHIA
jgi:3-oxoacyl-[acyl-carrier-protein] synthase II